MNPFLAGTTVSTVQQDSLPVFQEYAWDFDINQFLYNPDGSHQIVERKEALKVWIKKALLVERYRYRAYFDDYGAELERFVGKYPNDGAAQVELFRYIKEALLVNPWVQEVTDVSFSQEKKHIRLEISLTTVYGTDKIGIEV